MKPVDHDVYLCCRDAEHGGIAAEVAAGLGRLGFRVFVAGRGAAGVPDARRFEAIEATLDFVLLSSPAGTTPGGGPDPRAADLAHAFKTNRNIVVLADPADADPLAAPDPPGFPPFAPWQRVVYDRTRPRESIALVGHRLVSSSEIEDRRLMRVAKRAFVVAGLVLAAAVALRAVPAVVSWWNRPTAPQPLPRFTLYWAADGRRLQGGQWTSFPVADGGALATGDQWRVLFSPGSDGYAYLVLRDAQGGVSLLYPGAALRGASRVRAGSLYQAPGEGHWFPVDDGAGVRAVYLFAGHEPLENLEELLDEADSPGNPAVRLELLTSTLAGLLDGRHTAVPRPIRTRRGREIVDGLPPVPAPPGWPAPLSGDAAATNGPAVQTGLLSTVVEIRLRPVPPA
jgi:hypothetical protein